VSRQLAELRANPPRPDREWQTAGVVRAVISDAQVVVLSHGEMPGYMRAMTMGFRAATPRLYEGIKVGDEVEFTVRGRPPRVAITAMAKIAPGASLGTPAPAADSGRDGRRARP